MRPHMKSPPPILNPHRRARVVLWARTMLMWAALVLFSILPARGNRRHIRQRYGFLSLDLIERLVHALMLVRAVEIARVCGGSRRSARDASPLGFRRPIRRSGLMRASLGSRFRAAFRCRDLHERTMLLLAAIADIDGFARRYLVQRVSRRLTRRRAIIIVSPQAQALIGLDALAPSVVDSS